MAASHKENKCGVSRRQFISAVGLLALLPLIENTPMWSNQSETTITIPPGATTGARIVISQTGIIAYDNNNNIVLQFVPDTGINTGFPIPGIVVGQSNAMQLTLFASGPDGELLIDANDPDFDFGSITSALGGFGTAKVSTSLWSPPHSKLGGYGEIQLNSGSKDLSTRPRVDIDIVDPSAAITAQNIVSFQLNSITLLPEIIIQPGTIKWGSGTPGKYYYEEWGIGAVTILTAGTTNVIATVGNPLTNIQQISDYSGTTQMALSTGTWTAPDNGKYTVSMQVQYTGGAVGSRMGLYALRNGNANTNACLVLETVDNSGRGRTSLAGTRWFNAGDTLKFFALQGSGASQVIQSGTDVSYISISKEF